MPRTKKTPKRYGFSKRFYKRKNTPMSNMRNLVDSVKALSNGSQVPLSDIYDGYGNRKTMVPTKIPRNINDQIVWARCIVDRADSLSAVAETFIGSYFTLSNHPEASSYAALFDQYCIPAVVIQIRSTETTATYLAGPMPRVYSVIDHDDANSISVSTAKEFNSCQEQRTVDNVTRILYPRVAVGAYSGAFTSFANQRTWIDCASNGVQHYGVKIVAEADTRSSAAVEILTRFEIYYAFKNRH